MRISKYSGYGLVRTRRAAESLRAPSVARGKASDVHRNRPLDPAPALLLREAENFGELKVLATAVAETTVSPDAMRALPTDEPREEGWDSRLEQMVAAAGAHGWVADGGSVRAHLEWRRPGDGGEDPPA